MSTREKSINWQVRTAGLEDAILLSQLISKSFRDVADQFCLTPENAPTHPSNCAPEWVSAAMEKGVRYFILEWFGEPCGCVAMEIAGDEHCYLERLAVLPEYRHQGFGRLLVDHVVRKAKDIGLARVEIAIIAGHHVLREWYEAQGFVLTSTRAFPTLPFEVAFMALSIG